MGLWIVTVGRASAAPILRRLYTDGERCAEDEPSEAPEPIVEHALAGSFSAPHAAETLYSILEPSCGALRTESRVTLAVFRGDARVLRVTLGPTQHVAPERAFDLDGDGQDEVLSVSGYGPWQGLFRLGAELVRFSRGALVRIEDFGTVAEDTCTSGFCNAYAASSQVRAQTRRGRAPTFTVDRWRAPCPPDP